MRILPWVAAAVLLGCGDDSAPIDPPLVTGPYAGNLELGPDTRHRLPDQVETISPADPVRFYWYHPDAGGKTLVFDVRAETTALAPSTVIHTERVDVPASGVPQGMIRFEARHLNQGGARRNEHGQLEWLPGIYSVKARLGDGEPFGTGIFEVR